MGKWKWPRLIQVEEKALTRLERNDQEGTWHKIKMGGDQTSGPVRLEKWEPLKDLKI